jgi:hypothetical protein
LCHRNFSKIKAYRINRHENTTADTKNYENEIGSLDMSCDGVRYGLGSIQLS